MKPGTRFLGIDDAAFNFQDQETFLTGVVYRGTEFIEDIESVKIKIDGNKATKKIISLFENLNNTEQIKVIFLDGISFGGFNIADIYQISQRTNKPVIAVTSNKPDMEKFEQTMRKTSNFDSNFQKMDEAEKVELKDGSTYIQYAGIKSETAKKAVKNSIIHGLTPEPVRVAHMIGKAFDIS